MSHRNPATRAPPPNREKIINRGGSNQGTSLLSSGNNVRPPPNRVRPNYGQPNANGRPNLIVANSPSQYPNHQEFHNSPGSHDAVTAERDVIVKDAYRQDTSVVIQWDSDTNNILGFRVVYRLFGDNTFQPGPPLDPSEREFKIKNVPAQVTSGSAPQSTQRLDRVHWIVSGESGRLRRFVGGEQRHAGDGSVFAVPRNPNRRSGLDAHGQNHHRGQCRYLRHRGHRRGGLHLLQP